MSYIESFDDTNGTFDPFASYENLSWTNETSSKEPPEEFIFMIATSTILGLIILATIVGNLFVLAAIYMEKNLHSVGNYLIFSLGVADLMVSCLVMPLAAVYQVTNEWKFGRITCEMWISVDVLSCTASILHLVAIALDRYWSVSSVDYIHQRSPKRIICMIMIIWGVAFLVSVAQFLAKAEYSDETKDCFPTKQLLFQLFGTLSSFYVPLAVILFLYYRIYHTAKKRIRKRHKALTSPTNRALLRPSSATGASSRNDPDQTTSSFMAHSSNNPSPERAALLNGGQPSEPPQQILQMQQMLIVAPSSPNLSVSMTGVTPENTPLKKTKKPKHESGESKRERKAAKTLAIITGAFVICWLPFFTDALISAIWASQLLNVHVVAIFYWLGCCNSTINPIIYTIFNPEFRLAFKKIIFGKQYVNRTSRGVAV